jgi:uncharacterized UBP type Zn finger protein
MKKLVILMLMFIRIANPLLSMNEQSLNDCNDDDILNSFQNLTEGVNREKKEVNLSDVIFQGNSDTDNFNHDDNFGGDYQAYAASCYDVLPSLGKRFDVQGLNDDSDFFIRSIPIAPCFQDEDFCTKKGILNENGSDCFIISSLQVLKNIPEFLDVLKTKTSFNQALESFMRNVHDNKLPVSGISTLRAHLTTSDYLKEMKFGQQDAQEFISGLLTELNQDDKDISKNFGLGIEQSFLCASCGHGWKSTDHKELLLPLHLSAYTHANLVSIEELINEIKEEEFIEDGTCEACNARGIVRSIALSFLPKNLIISFKRFTYQNGQAIRLNVKVSLQETLVVNDNTYQLCGVILHHSGHEDSITAGHYTAYVKDSDQAWYHYNDGVCTQVLISDVTQPSSEPYICLYRQQ